SAKQCQVLGWRDDWNQALFEIARVAGNEVIGLTLGSGDCLNGVLEIAPAGMGSLRSKRYFFGLA
ncbi:MAG: hypothetical protein AB1482_14285, partial [Pseudomonadota bacterium]